MSVQDVISFFYPDPKTKLGELVIDAFISETHNYASELTEHPIETGGVIVDHVHNLPFSLSISGIISNTPMSLVGLTAFDSAKRFFNDEKNDFCIIASEKIEDIFRKREPITISTSLKDYKDMVLESLSLERGGGSVASFQFQCTAKQIRFVEQKRIDVPPKPKTNRAKPKQNKGMQETKAPSKEIQKKSETWLFGTFKDISLSFPKIDI